MFRRIALRILGLDVLRKARHQIYMAFSARLPSKYSHVDRPIKVLVLGIYVGDRENTIEHLLGAYASSSGVTVQQRWIALNKVSLHPDVVKITTRLCTHRVSKYSLVNTLLEADDLRNFDYIIMSDDDIHLKRNFLPAFLAHQTQLGFAVAQPARAWHSYFDLSFPLRRPWLRARQTRFVECGPLVSMRADAASLLLPFDEAAPMWGLDLTWPTVIENNQLTMGIVDAVSVDHSMRPQAKTYSRAQEQEAMEKYLERTPHLSPHEAFVVLKTYN